MSKGRIIIAIVLVLLVAAAAGLFVLRGRLDSIVARAIEHHGSRLTGTSVTVGAVELHLRQGRATIDDVRVANPQGFSDRTALALGRLVLDIDPGSLIEQPYVIEDLEITDVRVLYEIDAGARRNLDVIREHLAAAGPAASSPQEATEPPLLIVHRMHLSGGEVEADASALGVEPRTADLPGFTLTDLGTPDGKTATAIGKRALEQIIDQAARAALNDALEQRLGDVLDEELGEKVGNAVEEKLGDLIDR